MVKIFNSRYFKDAGLYMMYGLAFFLLAVVGCETGNKQVSVVWTDGKAVAIAIPKALVSDDAAITVRLHGSETPILGELQPKGNAIEFHPLIPLSPGMAYEIWEGDKQISDISLQEIKGLSPQVAAIYPEQDTLPENQLKLYISFTNPMQTGRALDYISLLDSKGDTLHRVFLDLQPELWNEAGTVLTLWLDPGRIKRDLVLNKELGNPLHQSQTYKVVVSDKWKDRRGLALGKPYVKQLVAGGRDGAHPDINKWVVKLPKAGSGDALVVNTLEPLDHYLLSECVSVIDGDGKDVKGKFDITDKDKGWKFIPDANWTAGHYQIKVQAKLEDLAGNNLNRVFDRDIRKDKQTNKEFFVRGVEVR